MDKYYASETNNYGFFSFLPVFNTIVAFNEDPTPAIVYIHSM